MIGQSHQHRERHTGGLTRSTREGKQEITGKGERQRDHDNNIFPLLQPNGIFISTF